MSQLFSTELLAPSDRIDAWQWNAQQICGNCRIRLLKSSFHGSIEIRHLGGLPLTRFSSSPLSFWKWPSDTVTAENHSCIVITQLAGIRRYSQNGAEVLLKPGDSTVIDSGRPWSSSCGTDCVRLYLRVPRWMMEDRLRTRDIPIAHRIFGGSGTGAALYRLSQSLYDDAAHTNAAHKKEEEGTALLEAYFEILAACIGGGKVPIQYGSELSERILEFIDTHISEPTLGPVEVASAMGISVRHLHRLVSATGNTLGEYIRGRRLEQCRADLANPRLREKTITEIAFLWGFSDAAHFSHAFRKQFGISPRSFRTHAAIKERRGIKDLRAEDFLGAEPSAVRYCAPN